MAKPVSRPAILPGSAAPYTMAKRLAGPERWDKPFSEKGLGQRMRQCGFAHTRNVLNQEVATCQQARHAILDL